MSDEKNRFNKAYDEGYNDGKTDGLSGNLSQSFSKGWKTPFTDGKEEQSYNKGYDDGASDKYDSDSSHYSGGTSESSSDCFITTATLVSIGKLDNCDELMTFRNFRDCWLSKQADGQKLISEYYKIAPTIVTAINSSPSNRKIYRQLWTKSIKPCFDLIKQSRFTEAKNIYCNVVSDLKQKFLD